MRLTISVILKPCIREFARLFFRDESGFWPAEVLFRLIQITLFCSAFISYKI